MANVEHNALTGSSLHEPKDIAAASAGDIYVADGAASGTMTSMYGQHSIYIQAGSMTPTTTNGASAGSEEQATNDVMLEYLAFDGATDEFATFSILMPKSWNAGTLIARYVWVSATETSTADVDWALQARNYANDDAADQAYGTAIVVTDAGGTAAKDIMISGESTAITVGGTPAAEEFVQFKVYRDATADTSTGDAWLLGILLHYTVDAITDS